MPRLVTLGLLVAAALLTTGPTIASQQRQQSHGRLFPPENLGELEGSDRDTWQRSDQIMDALGIAEGSVVADLGAGSGREDQRQQQRAAQHGGEPQARPACAN